jgi:polar amino acid transport system substrate-binding protein
MKRAVLAVLVMGATTGLAACGSTTGSAATSPGPAAPGVVNAAQVRPAGAQPVQVQASSSSAGTSCHGRPTTASLAPSGPLPPPGQMPVGSYMAEIYNAGVLKAGVDQNTLLWGYLNPTTHQLEGIDIDMVNQVAKAIFGSDWSQHLQFEIVPNADRQIDVAKGMVDLVAETMTITCGRQDGSDPPAVDFSSEYYDAHQEVLIPRGSSITSIAGLNGRRVCAAQGSTSLATLKQVAPQVELWEVANETDCLVMLQQGQVDAISTDDTILDGFVAQDPNLEILKQNGILVELSDEPYGMAISNAHPDFVRFVNAVLANEVADGTWAKIWAQDLKSPVVNLPEVQYRGS